MKLLFIIITSFILTGCATTNHVVEIPKIKPSPLIMKECLQYIEPKEYTFDEFKILLIKNKEVYLLCEKQNKEKMQFILNNY